MEYLTTDFFTEVGIEWKDDSRGKAKYEGDILVYIGGFEFTNGYYTKYGRKFENYENSFDRVPTMSFSNIEELKQVYRVLNNWKELEVKGDGHE